MFIISLPYIGQVKQGAKHIKNPHVQGARTQDNTKWYWSSKQSNNPLDHASHLIIALGFNLQRPFQRWLTSALVHSLWTLLLMLFSLTPAMHRLITLTGSLHKVTYTFVDFGRFSTTLFGFLRGSTLTYQDIERFLLQVHHVVPPPLASQWFFTHFLASGDLVFYIISHFGGTFLLTSSAASPKLYWSLNYVQSPRNLYPLMYHYFRHL